MTTAPYGSWTSPIDAARIATSGVRLSQVLAGDTVHWQEMRPAEGGRCTVVQWRDGEATGRVPAPFNVRTRVHEYGGGSYLVDGDAVVFANFTDQRLYRAMPGAPPAPITPEADVRYADGVVDLNRRRIVCVREDHSQGDREAVNAIVALDPDAHHTGDALVAGNDFYAAPRFSPDGSQFAWLTWNHPAMPWDAAELWVAPVRADGSMGEARHVAGGAREAIIQPEWSPEGELVFVSDRTNWWNLYAWRGGRAEPLAPMAAAGPPPSPAAHASIVWRLWKAAM